MTNTLPFFAAAVPPAVAITSPAAATVFAVATPVLISGTCTPGCHKVELRFNGSLLRETATITGSTWSFWWSPGLNRAGTFNMVARAYRGAKHTDSAARSFTVDNVPLRSKFGATGDFWHADDLAYSDGATVATWTGRVNANAWISSTATMLTAGFPNPAGAKKCVATRVASSGKMTCNGMAGLFGGTNPAVSFFQLRQVPAGLGTGTQMDFTATSSSSSTPKWLVEHVGTPGAVKVAKRTTTLTFPSAGDAVPSRVDFGVHGHLITDTGTSVNVWRDSGAVMTALTPQTLDVADSVFDRVSLGVQDNAGSNVNFADNNYRCVALFPTSTFTAAEAQYLLNFCLGNYDNDQYYGDASTAFEVQVCEGQSNMQGLAVSTLPAVASSQTFFYSDNNWLSDPVALSAMAPEGAGPYIGYWYQNAIARQAAIPTIPVHSIGAMRGAQDLARFYEFGNGDYYATTLLDEFYRNVETAKCLFGGSPSWRIPFGQGESDAQSAVLAPQYLTNMNILFPLYRGRLGATTPVVIIQLNGNSPGQAQAATVKTAQSDWVAADAHAVLVVTDDILYPGGFISTLHYNEASQVIVGGRSGSAVVP